MLAASALIIGALVPGVVALVSARSADLVPPEAMSTTWGVLTGVFAVSQALSGFGMAAAYQWLDLYRPLFFAGGTFLAIGALALLAGERIGRTGTIPSPANAYPSDGKQS